MVVSWVEYWAVSRVVQKASKRAVDWVGPMAAEMVVQKASKKAVDWVGPRAAETVVPKVDQPVVSTAASMAASKAGQWGSRSNRKIPDQNNTQRRTGGSTAPCRTLDGSSRSSQDTECKHWSPARNSTQGCRHSTLRWHHWAGRNLRSN